MYDDVEEVEDDVILLAMNCSARCAAASASSDRVLPVAVVDGVSYSISVDT